nr:hypothetical protein [Chromobacterium sp. ASV5]
MPEIPGHQFNAAHYAFGFVVESEFNHAKLLAHACGGRNVLFYCHAAGARIVAVGGAYRRLARGGASKAAGAALSYRWLGELPDHFHCPITLSFGDSDFSNRIKAIKIRLVRQLAASEFRNAARAKKGERGVWPRRFWEHLIRDAADFARHLDDIHRNPL